MIFTALVGVSGIIYYLVESQRVKKLNEKVDTLEEALRRIEALKNK